MEETMKKLLILVTIIILAPLATTAAQTEEAAEFPEKFRANLMVTNAPGGMARMTSVSITIEGWTTDEERGALLVALRDGGTDGLVRAMQDLDVGYVQVGNSLGWRLRTAASWQTEEGRKVRVATDRPIHIQEHYRGTRSQDYPIGVIEFLLPPTGEGEGAFLAATRVQFNDQGRIEVESLPTNTGPQKLTLVEKVAPKKKKKKKNKAGGA
jgi:hypothetical protein